MWARSSHELISINLRVGKISRQLGQRNGTEVTTDTYTTYTKQTNKQAKAKVRE